MQLKCMRKNRLVVESTVLSSNVFTRPSKKINKIRLRFLKKIIRFFLLIHVMLSYIIVWLLGVCWPELMWQHKTIWATSVVRGAPTASASLAVDMLQLNANNWVSGQVTLLLRGIKWRRSQEACHCLYFIRFKHLWCLQLHSFSHCC